MSWSLSFIPTAASTISHKVDALFFTLTTLTALIFSSVIAFILYFCAKYHHQSRAPRIHPIRNPLALELTWTLIPLVIMLGIFFWGAQVYLDLYQVPEGALEIRVIGKQWMWKFYQENGRRELGELHIPVGKPIKLIMTSEDVIHSLFIPNFRIKQDVLPGRLSVAWFEATQPGDYHLFCTQYCGTDHAGMGDAHLIAMTPTDYEAWYQRGNTPGNNLQILPLATQGRRLFHQYACNTCHFDQIGSQAPRLEGLFGSEVVLQDGKTVIADEDYLRESILDPNRKIVQGFQPLMPSFKNNLSEEQLMQLVVYLKSLKYSVKGSSESVE